MSLLGGFLIPSQLHTPSASEACLRETNKHSGGLHLQTPEEEESSLPRRFESPWRCLRGGAFPSVPLHARLHCWMSGVREHGLFCEAVFSVSVSRNLPAAVRSRFPCKLPSFVPGRRFVCFLVKTWRDRRVSRDSSSGPLRALSGADCFVCSSVVCLVGKNADRDSRKTSSFRLGKSPVALSSRCPKSTEERESPPWTDRPRSECFLVSR